VNTLKVFFLMFVLTCLFLLVGDLVGGQRGMVIALAFGGIFNLVSYWFSDKIVLAMYHAKRVTEAEAPELYSIVRELTAAAELPMPALAIIPQEAPNAFATGRNHAHAVVAVTEGMMRMVNRDELKGVLAHELAHVRNYDMLIGTFAATLAAAIAFLPRMLLFFGGGDREDRSPLGPIAAIALMIIAPLVALLVRMAISRAAEYRADADGAKFAGNPLSLASALGKLDAFSKRIPMAGNEVTAHMFIVNPFAGSSFLRMFSTHPPIERRVQRLREMAFGPR